MDILLTHGSPDCRHGEQVRVLAGKVAEILGEQIGASFLSEKSLPRGARVLPLFLGEGKHVSEDIPKLADASDCVVLPPLAACADRIAELALEELTHDTRRINALFVLYRFGGFEKLAAALYAKAKICSKHALASLHSEPSIHSVLQHWQQEGVETISLQPMLLFEGHSLVRLQSMIKGSNIQVTNDSVLSELAKFPALIADCLKS